MGLHALAIAARSYVLLSVKIAVLTYYATAKKKTKKKKHLFHVV